MPACDGCCTPASAPRAELGHGAAIARGGRPRRSSPGRCSRPANRHNSTTDATKAATRVAAGPRASWGSASRIARLAAARPVRMACDRADCVGSGSLPGGCRRRACAGPVRRSKFRHAHSIGSASSPRIGQRRRVDAASARPARLRRESAAPRSVGGLDGRRVTACRACARVRSRRRAGDDRRRLPVRSCVGGGAGGVRARGSAATAAAASGRGRRPGLGGLAGQRSIVAAQFADAHHDAIAAHVDSCGHFADRSRRSPFPGR